MIFDNNFLPTKVLQLESYLFFVDSHIITGVFLFFFLDVFFVSGFKSKLLKIKKIVAFRNPKWQLLNVVLVFIAFSSLCFIRSDMQSACRQILPLKQRLHLNSVNSYRLFTLSIC